MIKVIFLDFDGVMDTAYYDHVLAKEGKPGNDEYGIIWRNRQTLWGGCAAANPKLLLNDT